MRAAALSLYFALSLGPIGFCQQVDAKRTTLRAQAEQSYSAEMARQKAGDCPNANNTAEFNVCYSNAAGIADQNLKSYEGAIRDLLSLNSPSPAPSQSVAEFDHMEQLWRSYLHTARAAAFHQFGGGTGGPSFGMEIHLRLVRGHMAELNTIYGMLLRL